jgi:hypothetical protein
LLVPTKKNNNNSFPVKKSKKLPVPVRKNRYFSPNFGNSLALADYAFSRFNEVNSNISDETSSVSLDLDLLSPKSSDFKEVEISDNPGLIEVLQSNSDKLSNSVSSLSVSVSQGVVVLPLILNEIKNLVNAVNSVSSSIEFSNVISSHLVHTLSDNLSSLSRAKELEAEYYEFNKNPIQFTTSDGEVIANITPREIQARKNALDYHLANDEATLKYDDLDLSDYSDAFDVDNILELFKFFGISDNIKDMKG